ncbi:MAG: alternative ribosome rescue aminoacyl-tRNA hydrolase ArfB [Bdellovibrionota bacterium]
MEFRPPLQEIEFSYVRSSGPGGQNVNKVNSKCVLRWNLVESTSLTVEQKARLFAKLKLTVAGELVIMSDRYRDQIRNREDCVQKLQELVAKGLLVPRRRKKTKPSFSSQRRAQESKARHSEKKRMRRGHGRE